jgi:hypothetical protein
MKKLAAMLCLSAMATGAFAQGLVNFANNPNTLVSANIGGNVATLSGPVGSYYFGLLTSATGGAGSWTFSGLTGTNLVNSTGGRFTGGNGVAVPNWAAGATMSYQVAAWESSLGTTFNPAWLVTAPNGLFGLSAIGTGVAGGGAQSLPTLQLFGGTGITAGFTLTGGAVPEPSSMALFGLGAAALVIFRRRK